MTAATVGVTTGLEIPLLQKWRRLQLRIKAAQRQVPQAMQPSLLNLLPLGPEHILPLIGKLGLLWHHMLDR